MKRAGVAVVALVAASLLGAGVAQAAYPGANGRIAFQRFTSTSASDVWTMNPDGSDARQITHAPGYNRIPVWSPDGTKIAFTSSRDGPESIYVMNADGSDVTRLTTAPLFDFAPTWSPDGTKIAFRRAGGQPDEIWVMNADGSGQTRLTSGTADYDPSWSPDGTKIAFWSQRDGEPEVYVMNADGSGPTNLTHDPDHVDLSPDWSPDGSRIAFVSDRASGEYDIYTMKADGTDVRLVTGGIVPSWAPDGTKLTYASGGYLSIVNVVGTDVFRIPGGTGLEYNPDWQPIPNRPPDCSSVRASPDVLSPPNHRFRVVSLTGATDPDGDPLALSIDGVTQDEPLRGQGDHTSPVAVLIASSSDVRLRAERRLRGDGRVYRVAFTVSDNHGGNCAGTASVGVPRNPGVPAIDSAPPSYDSLGP